MKRRDFLLGVTAAPLAAALAPGAAAARQAPPRPARTKIRQSVMASVWGDTKLTFEQRCETLQRIGYQGIDLPTADQAVVMKKYGLTPGMMTGAGTSFQNGLIRKEMHDTFEKATREGIDTCARVGCSNLIAMPGERRGMSRDEGADNMVAFFNR